MAAKVNKPPTIFQALKPMLLLNGISALRLHVCKETQSIIIDGIQSKKPFQQIIPWADIEAAFSIQPDKIKPASPINQAG